MSSLSLMDLTDVILYAPVIVALRREDRPFGEWYEYWKHSKIQIIRNFVLELMVEMAKEEQDVETLLAMKSMLSETHLLALFPRTSINQLHYYFRMDNDNVQKIICERILKIPTFKEVMSFYHFEKTYTEFLVMCSSGDYPIEKAFKLRQIQLVNTEDEWSSILSWMFEFDPKMVETVLLKAEKGDFTNFGKKTIKYILKRIEKSEDRVKFLSFIKQ